MQIAIANLCHSISPGSSSTSRGSRKRRCKRSNASDGNVQRLFESSRPATHKVLISNELSDQPLISRFLQTDQQVPKTKSMPWFGTWLARIKWLKCLLLLSVARVRATHLHKLTNAWKSTKSSTSGKLIRLEQL